MTVVQHLNLSSEHYGPGWLADAAHEVMGGIDLDPFSCAAANRVIGAKQFFGLPRDGLAMPWQGRIYCNPPSKTPYYNVRGNYPSIVWHSLAFRYARGDISQAIFVVFNLELFRYVQRFEIAHPFDFQVCLFSERVRYWATDENGVLFEQTSPGHPSAVVYLGDNRAKFDSVFSAFGKVTKNG